MKKPPATMATRSRASNTYKSGICTPILFGATSSPNWNAHPVPCVFPRKSVFGALFPHRRGAPRARASLIEGAPALLFEVVEPASERRDDGVRERVLAVGG